MPTKMKVIVFTLSALTLAGGVFHSQSKNIPLEDPKVQAAAPVLEQKLAAHKKLNESLTKGQERSQQFDVQRAEILKQWQTFSKKD